MSDNLPKELIVDPSSVKDIKKIVKEELKNLPEDKIGSIVEGNPEGEATEVLTKLSIKNEGQETIFGISAGGSKFYKHTITYMVGGTTYTLIAISPISSVFNSQSFYNGFKNGDIVCLYNTTNASISIHYLNRISYNSNLDQITIYTMFVGGSGALSVSASSQSFVIADGDDVVTEL